MSKATPKYSKKGLSPNPQKGLQKDIATGSQWTPIQQEQIELAKQLDLYIDSFKAKLLMLNFKPSHRELIILFIMNLHPRWRRFIEPVELSFATWLDAAKHAQRHCRRVSAMLGCEDDDQESFFKTAELKTLRDAGYFSPGFGSNGSMNPSIQKLLIPSLQQQDIDQVLSHTRTPVLKPVTSRESPSSSTVESKQPKEPLNIVQPSSPVKKPEQPKKQEASRANVTPEQPKKQEAPRANITPEQPKKQDVVPEKPIKNTTQEAEIPSGSQSRRSNDNQRRSKTPRGSQNRSRTNSQTSGETPSGTYDSYSDVQQAFAHAIRKQIVDSYTEQIQLVTEKIVTNSKETETVTASNGKDREMLVPIVRKDNSEEIARIPVMREEDIVDGSDQIIENVPKSHKGVNLTFLELKVNGNNVRALLAKLSWGCSAMSIDCAKRLQLPIRMSENFGILTDFGYVDADGDVDFPIQHPADPKLKKEMRVCLLPKIYGGKVDMVLGSDFFFYFNPSLNIQKRTISFFGKETPYVVAQLE